MLDYASFNHNPLEYIKSPEYLLANHFYCSGKHSLQA